MKNVFFLLLLFTQSAYSQHIDFNDYDFSQIDSIAINYKFEGNLDPIKIANDLTNGLEKDIDKYRVIFKWISENVEYDIKLYLKVMSHNYNAQLAPRKAEMWSKKLRKLYINHTIKRRITICEGYSWLLETMCGAVGLTCSSIYGYVRHENSKIGLKPKPSHAWNAVKINNKTYLSDPTWASGYVNFHRMKYYKEFDETYFLVSPDQFISNHYPFDTHWILLLEKPTLAEFINSPIKTTAFIDNKIPNYSPTKGKINLKIDSVFQFQFSMNKELKSFWIEKSTIRNKKFISEIFTDYPQRSKEGYHVSSIRFSEKGDYSLEIFINRRLTLIYNVRVN